MQIPDFKVGSTYRITRKDWKTPDGDIITGKESINTILEPASKSNTSLDGEEPSEMVLKEWQAFLRVKCIGNGKIHLLHPRTISFAEKLD